MSADIQNERRPWYREMWPWLLMLPPAAAVFGGVSMVYLATSAPSTLVVDDYSRIEAITSDRFARDARALELGIMADVAISDRGGDAADFDIAVELRADTADFRWPAELVLKLQHATRDEADREIALRRRGDRYVAVADLVIGRYGVELMPASSSWRLGGLLVRFPGRLRLVPQSGPARAEQP